MCRFVEVDQQISGRLRHPLTARVRVIPAKWTLRLSSSNDEQHIQPGQPDRPHREEITWSMPAVWAPKELCPARALRRGAGRSRCRNSAATTSPTPGCRACSTPHNPQVSPPRILLPQHGDFDVLDIRRGALPDQAKNPSNCTKRERANHHDRQPAAPCPRCSQP
jgi:hypothetical protein